MAEARGILPHVLSLALYTNERFGEIGKLALVGDVWCQIIDIREYTEEDYCGKEDYYKLYSKEQWIPKSWIKQIISKNS